MLRKTACLLVPRSWSKQTLPLCLESSDKKIVCVQSKGILYFMNIFSSEVACIHSATIHGCEHLVMSNIEK